MESKNGKDKHDKIMEDLKDEEFVPSMQDFMDKKQ
jgi:hypothetical protein